MVNPYEASQDHEVIQADLAESDWTDYLVMSPGTAVSWTFIVHGTLWLRLLVYYLTMPTY